MEAKLEKSGKLELMLLERSSPIEDRVAALEVVTTLMTDVVLAANPEHREVFISSLRAFVDAVGHDRPGTRALVRARADALDTRAAGSGAGA